MNYLILIIIQLYWKLIPAKNRRRCIFKKSCSHYVFDTAKKEGFLKGIQAFKFRYQNCRSGFKLFKNPITNETQMVLPSKVVVGSEEIAERFIHK
jgi:uncharacterized protein